MCSGSSLLPTRSMDSAKEVNGCQLSVTPFKQYQPTVHLLIKPSITRDNSNPSLTRLDDVAELELDFLALLPPRRLDSLVRLLDLIDLALDGDPCRFGSDEREDDVFEDDEVEREVAGEVSSEFGGGASEPQDGFGASKRARYDGGDEESGVESFFEADLRAFSGLRRGESGGDVGCDLVKLSNESQAVSRGANASSLTMAHPFIPSGSFSAFAPCMRVVDSSPRSKSKTPCSFWKGVDPSQSSTLTIVLFNDRGAHLTANLSCNLDATAQKIAE